MKTRITYLALAAFASVSLAFFQGCYTQFGSTSRPDDGAEYVTSDSVSYDEYSDARRQFYMDQSYPYSSGYMGGSPLYGSWGSGWGMYGGHYPGYYGRSAFGYSDPFYDSYYYGYGTSPWYSRWGMMGWAGYGGWMGYNTAYYPVAGGYSGRGAGTTRTIGSRRSVSGSQSFLGGTRGNGTQPTSGIPAPSSMTLPSGARRGTVSAPPLIAPRILPPANTGRRGYDGERRPPVVSAPTQTPPPGGGRAVEHRASPPPPAPAPSAPPPASGNRGGETRTESSGSSRGGNRR
jgi:hypothetical protein